MKTQLDISQLLEIGKIENELDFERALIADRKLRVLAKENPKYKVVRKELRSIIEAYENKNWSETASITDEKIHESEVTELIAEKERIFLKNRKELIRKELKKYNLTQQNLGEILSHPSKSYVSELMNGISPFSLKDLIVINRLLKIDLTDLIPTFLAQSDREKIKSSILKLDNPKLTLSTEGFALA